MTFLWVLFAVCAAAGLFFAGWSFRRQADQDTMAAARTILEVGKAEAEIGTAVSQLAAGLEAMLKVQESTRLKVLAMEGNVLLIYNALSAMGALSVVPRIRRNESMRPRATGEPPRGEIAPPLLERGAEPDESLF